MGIFNDNPQNLSGGKGPAGRDGIGFKLTDDGNYDINGKRLTNLANGTDDDNAVNLAQLKSFTDSHQNNYHLRDSFKFYKNYGDKAELTVKSNIIVLNHNHHDLYVAAVEGSSPSSFSVKSAWVSLRMTNNLPSGTYTVLFEIFSAIVPSVGNITFLNRESLIQAINGDGNYNLITFDHDYQTTHSKEYIQFTSNGQPGEITFQFRFYGSEHKNADLSFLFYSRVVSGKVGYAFNHQIFYVDNVQLKDQILYFEDIQMNDNKIKGLADPSEDDHAANMKYVNDKIQTRVNALFSKIQTSMIYNQILILSQDQEVIHSELEWEEHNNIIMEYGIESHQVLLQVISLLLIFLLHKTV